MRINKFVASASGISRRAADTAITNGRVLLNGRLAVLGDQVTENDVVQLDGMTLVVDKPVTILLHKPIGYVCSRNGQGSATIYDLLPPKLHHLKPIGRLDKDSSGLLLLTSDGDLAQQLAHPSLEKRKVYHIELDRMLENHDAARLNKGVRVEDYTSHLEINHITGNTYQVSMHTGKNRQIRKTFEVVGYTVRTLHRTEFGPYTIGTLKPGAYQVVGGQLS